jgi:nitrogen-specific signal transduction histidine kinase
MKTLFEPKFVAEDGRIRTRWGLATSRQILLQHQGQLDLKSTPGKGTSVKVLLPVRELRETGEEK